MIQLFNSFGEILTSRWCFLSSLFVTFPLSFLAQEALKMLAVSFSPHSAAGLPSAAAPPPLSKPHVPLTPVPGIPDTLASIQLLTARYRRRPLTVDEMEYIQVRGPSSYIMFSQHLVDNLSFLKPNRFDGASGNEGERPAEMIIKDFILCQFKCYLITWFIWMKLHSELWTHSSFCCLDTVFVHAKRNT